MIKSPVQAIGALNHFESHTLIIQVYSYRGNLRGPPPMPPFPRNRAPIRPNQDTMVVNGPFNKVLFLFGGYIEVYSPNTEVEGRYLSQLGFRKNSITKPGDKNKTNMNPSFLHL